jgi:hypothetical protein
MGPEPPVGGVCGGSGTDVDADDDPPLGVGGGAITCWVIVAWEVSKGP